MILLACVCVCARVVLFLLFFCLTQLWISILLAFHYAWILDELTILATYDLLEHFVRVLAFSYFILRF